jgi:hypothetical protein
LHRLIEDAVREDATKDAEPGVSAGTFHALQENMNGFWIYRTDPK